MKTFIFIKRFTVAFACLAALLLGCSAALAQIPGGDKNAAGMNAAMVRLFGSNTNFISKAEVRVLDKNQQETTSMPMGFEMLGGKVRVDINMSQVKSKEMSPDFVANMKQMGMDQMTTILLPDKKVVLSIYPGLKAYAATPMAKDEIDAATQTYKIEKTRLGKETIDGRACEKNNVTLTDGKGEKQHAIIWNAADLKDFPVQMQIAADDSTLIMKFKDIKLGRPDASHFDAPAGLTKYDSVNALISEAITKKMNAPAK